MKQVNYATHIATGEPGNPEIFFAVPPVIQARARTIAPEFTSEEGFAYRQLCLAAGRGARLGDCQHKTLERLIRRYYFGVKF